MGDEVQNKRYLHAARNDDPELLSELEDFDPNHSDGLGNNALHYAAQNGSTRVIPEILEMEIDVDFQNRLKGDTPLHVAVSYDEDEDVRNWIVNELLEAGADPRIVNKENERPIDLIYGEKARSEKGLELISNLKEYEAKFGISSDDIARDDDDDDEGDDQASDQE